MYQGIFERLSENCFFPILKIRKASFHIKNNKEMTITKENKTLVNVQNVQFQGGVEKGKVIIVTR